MNLSSANETTPEARQEGASAPCSQLLAKHSHVHPRHRLRGFIGARVCELLLAAGHDVTGIDSLNDAYDIRLKQWRLARLVNQAGFQFTSSTSLSVSGLASSALERLSFDAVINLAARAGVRYSVENPWVYYEANTVGTLNLLEFCRRAESASSCWHPAPACTATTARCLSARTQTPTAPCHPTRHPRRRPRRSATRITALRSRCDGLSLLHRVRPGRTPGHDAVPPGAVDQ